MLERPKQVFRVVNIAAQVDFANGLLLARGVALLHDFGEAAGRIPHHPAQARGIFLDSRAQKTGRPTRREFRQQRAQRIGSGHGRIAGEHEHGPLVGRDFLATHHHRVAGAVLLGLKTARDAWTALDGAAHIIGPIADHDHGLLDAHGRERVEHIVEHWPPGNRHEHLGQLAAHSRAFACRHHDRQRFAHGILSLQPRPDQSSRNPGISFRTRSQAIRLLVAYKRFFRRVERQLAI